MYATVERSNPSLARRFIFITGLDDYPQFQKFIDTIALPALHKPVALDALRGEGGAGRGANINRSGSGFRTRVARRLP